MSSMYVCTYIRACTRYMGNGVLALVIGRHGITGPRAEDAVGGTVSSLETAGRLHASMHPCMDGFSKHQRKLQLTAA